MLEYERRRLDLIVRDQESKTGVGAHIHGVSMRASADQYSDLVKELHSCEGLLLFFSRAVEFQASCVEFVKEQHLVLRDLRAEPSFLGAKTAREATPLRVAEYQKIHDSFNLTASFQRHRLVQVQSLSKRVQTQLSVVRPLTSNGLRL